MDVTTGDCAWVVFLFVHLFFIIWRLVLVPTRGRKNFSCTCKYWHHSVLRLGIQAWKQVQKSLAYCLRLLHVLSCPTFFDGTIHINPYFFDTPSTLYKAYRMILKNSLKSMVNLGWHLLASMSIRANVFAILKGILCLLLSHRPEGLTDTLH